MRKFLSALSIVLILSNAAYAQFKTMPSVGVDQLQRQPRKQLFVKGKKMPKKALELAQNQKWVGNYTGDELCDPYESIGLPGYAGLVTALASYVPGSVFSRYTGDKIVGTRIGIHYPSGPVRVYLLGIDDEGYVGDDLFSANIDSPISGWNEVLLDGAYTITDQYPAYLFCVDYTQVDTNDGEYYNNECFPFSALTGEGTNPLYAYGDLGDGEGFYSWQNANLSIQALVESDALLSADLNMSAMSVSPFVKQGDDVMATITLSNEGNGEVSDYALSYSIDNGAPTELQLSQVITATPQNIEVNLGKYALGKHDVKIWVSKVAGEAPAGNLQDDEMTGSFRVYQQTKDRQKHLIEQFTSTSCTYCPLGIDLLKAFVSDRDDMIWVGIHGIQSPSVPDGMNNGVCDSIMAFQHVGAFPSASFDRLYDEEGTTATSLGYDASYHSMVIEYLFKPMLELVDSVYPALATVNIDAQYDENSKKLNVTVSGEGAEKASQTIPDGKLTVYLLEDGIVEAQLNLGTWDNAFVHNNVLRTALGKCDGNPIQWNGDNFKNTFSCNIEDGWKVENMRVVAFIHLPVTDDVTALNVLNANEGEIKNATAIKDVDFNATSQESVRYNVAGQLIGKGQKGLNIVKLANGKVVKVIEK